MQLTNGFKLIYDKIKEAAHNLYASKSNIPSDQDVAMATNITETYLNSIKLVYEKDGKLMISFTGIPGKEDASIIISEDGQIIIDNGEEDYIRIEPHSRNPKTLEEFSAFALPDIHEEFDYNTFIKAVPNISNILYDMCADMFEPNTPKEEIAAERDSYLEEVFARLQDSEEELYLFGLSLNQIAALDTLAGDAFNALNDSGKKAIISLLSRKISQGDLFTALLNAENGIVILDLLVKILRLADINQVAILVEMFVEMRFGKDVAGVITNGFVHSGYLDEKPDYMTELASASCLYLIDTFINSIEALSQYDAEKLFSIINLYLTFAHSGPNMDETNEEHIVIGADDDKLTITIDELPDYLHTVGEILEAVTLPTNDLELGKAIRNIIDSYWAFYESATAEDIEDMTEEDAEEYMDEHKLKRDILKLTFGHPELLCFISKTIRLLDTDAIKAVYCDFMASSKHIESMSDDEEKAVFVGTLSALMLLIKDGYEAIKTNDALLDAGFNLIGVADETERNLVLDTLDILITMCESYRAGTISVDDFLDQQEGLKRPFYDVVWTDNLYTLMEMVYSIFRRADHKDNDEWADILLDISPAGSYLVNSNPGKVKAGNSFEVILQAEDGYTFPNNDNISVNGLGNTPEIHRNDNIITISGIFNGGKSQITIRMQMISTND